MDDDPGTQIAFLKNKLTEERDDRLKTEGEACKILRGIKKKYDNILRERDNAMHDLRSSVAMEQERIIQLEDKNSRVVDELTRLKNQLAKSQKEVMRMEKTSPPRTPAPRTPTSGSPSKSASKANNADFIDKLGKEIADLKGHIDDYQRQLAVKSKELEEAAEKHKYTRDINIRLREEGRQLHEEIKQLKVDLRTAKVDAETKVRERMAEIEAERDEAKHRLKMQERDIERFKRQEKNLISTLEEKDKQLRAQESDIKELKEKCEKYRQEKALETEREKAALLSELQNLRKDLDKKSKDLQMQTSTADTLKRMCQEVEKQADEFDRLLQKKTDQYNRLLHEKESLELAKEKLKHEISTLKHSLALQKETHDKSNAELREKVKQLEESLAAETGRVKAMRRDLMEEQYKTEAESRRVADLQEQLQQCLDEADSADGRCEQLETEIREIKEEAARHITEVFNMQATVNSLKSSLAHANFTIQSLEERIECLLTQMEKEKLEAETEMFRLSERLRQHHVVENEMLSKIEKLEKTKKPLIGISPRPKPVSQSIGLTREFKHLDIELMKERQRYQELQEKLLQREAELAKLREGAKTQLFSGVLAASPVDPSAPPPPYLTSGSPPDSMTSSDNNMDAPTDDEEDGYSHQVVTVDVHHGTTLRRSLLHRRQEFSFTDSILEEIESDGSPKPSKTRYAN